MTVKCRKVTAALLSCILALLSLAAEFSHHHALPALQGNLTLQESQSGKESGNPNFSHGYNCIACHFAATQLAVFLASEITPAVAPSTFFLATFPRIDSQFSLQFFFLRAPPAVLA